MGNPAIEAAAAAGLRGWAQTTPRTSAWSVTPKNRGAKTEMKRPE
jgi:hypothetical protein